MDVLTIHIVEDSSDSAVFWVQVECANPFLLNFWFQKTFFNNGEVQQINTLRINGCHGLVFVLRVLHRSSRLPNSHYWCPFLVTLCLDALAFHYHLPSLPQWNGTLREAMRGNSLELRRWETIAILLLTEPISFRYSLTKVMDLTIVEVVRPIFEHSNNGNILQSDCLWRKSIMNWFGLF